MPRCPRCRSTVKRKPARLVCLACGAEGTILDATGAQRRAQADLDRAMRPRSVEATPPHNATEYLGLRRLRAAVQPGPRLPGEPRR